MASTIKRMVARYEADITDIKAKIAELNRIHIEMERKTTASGRSTQKHIDESVNAVNRLRMAYAGVAGIVGTLLASSAVQLADQAKQVDNQLKAIGASSDAARKSVYALAIETRTPLEATVGVLRSISKSMPNQELDETIRQVGTLNRLLTIGGLDAGQRGSVVLQFGQALQSGILSGDELRSLRESAPLELMDAIAKRAGGSVEQLRKMGEQGVITRDIMVGALTDLEQVSKDKFGAFEATVGESMGIFKTALIGVVGEMDDATNATSRMADVILGVGNFMNDHAQAAGTLASALATVSQYALLAAGARGFASLGPALAASAASAVVAARGIGTAVGALTLMRGALGSVMTLLGGPWGVAMFAAGAAVIALSNNVQSFNERMEGFKGHIEDVGSANESIDRIQRELASDSERLKTVNEQITKAIQDQASAAEATAVREKSAIEARIAKNRELLEVQRTIAREEVVQANEDLGAARFNLARRTGNQGPTFSMTSEQAALSYQQTIERERERLTAKSRSGSRLSDREVEWLEDYQALTAAIDDLDKRQAQLTDNTEQAATAHIRAWRDQQTAVEAAAKAQSDAVSALNADMVQRDAKIKELEKQRSLAMAAIDQPGLSREQQAAAAAAVASAEDQIRKLTDVEDRVEKAKAKYAELNRMMAGTGAVLDSDGSLRRLMDAIKDKMDAILRSGEDANNLELSQLETALAGVEVAASRAGEEVRKIAEQSFDAINANFDRLKTRLDSLGQPYAQEMANAVVADTNMVDFIKKKESFQSEAYYDENHWRAGYGTDTIYRRDQDGVWQAVEVLKGMRVTQEEANYALMRRLEQDFIPPIIEAIGQDKWQSMSENQKAAMASLSYNYGGGSWQNGALRSVAEAARSGTQQDVATAIASLAMGKTKSEREEGIKTKDGLPMNYHRRMEEAALFGDTSSVSEPFETANDEAVELAQRQRDYIESITDANERLKIEASLVNKTALERQRVLRTHEEEQKALEAGLRLDQRRAGQAVTVREEIVARVEEEINLEAQRMAADAARRDDEEAHMERLAEMQDKLNEKKNFNKEIQDDINGGIVRAIMGTGDWRDMTAQLLSKLAEAYLYAGLFNQGPKSVEGGKGIFTSIASSVGDWFSSTFSANGNVMTADGPIQLNRYAKGGIARRPQLSIFGEGSTPEAYVPLPDGRSIPVTIREPEVPSFSASATSSTLAVSIDLNHEMLDARITEKSAPLSAAITRRGLSEYSRNELPGRVRNTTRDPKRNG